mgnify:CR=1 FL=1
MGYAILFVDLEWWSRHSYLLSRTTGRLPALWVTHPQDMNKVIAHGSGCCLPVSVAQFSILKQRFSQIGHLQLMRIPYPRKTERSPDYKNTVFMVKPSTLCIFIWLVTPFGIWIIFMIKLKCPRFQEYHVSSEQTCGTKGWWWILAMQCQKFKQV